MDEHMMAAQIAALKSEIETLKPLAEKGLRLDRVIERLRGLQNSYQVTDSGLYYIDFYDLRALLDKIEEGVE